MGVPISYVPQTQPDKLASTDENGNILGYYANQFAGQPMYGEDGSQLQTVKVNDGYTKVGAINDGTGPWANGRMYYLDPDGKLVAEDGSYTGGYAGLDSKDPTQAASIRTGVGNTAWDMAQRNRQNLEASSGPDAMGQLLEFGVKAGFAVALGNLAGALATGTEMATGFAGTSLGAGIPAASEAAAAAPAEAGLINAPSTAIVPEEIATGTQATGYTTAATPAATAAPASWTDALAKAATPENFISGAAKSGAVNAGIQLATTGTIDPKKLLTNSILGGFGGILSQAVGGGVTGALVGGVASAVIGNAITGGKSTAQSAVSGAVPGLTTPTPPSTPGVPNINTVPSVFSDVGLPFNPAIDRNLSFDANRIIHG